MITDIGNGLVIIAAVLCWVFVADYHWLTGGDWRRSEAGKHLMASMASFGAVLTLSAVRVLAGAALNAPWFQILRTAVFVLVPVMFAWRIWLLVRSQRLNDAWADRRDHLGVLPPDDHHRDGH